MKEVPFHKRQFEAWLQQTDYRRWRQRIRHKREEVELEFLACQILPPIAGCQYLHMEAGASPLWAIAEQFYRATAFRSDPDFPRGGLGYSYVLSHRDTKHSDFALTAPCEVVHLLEPREATSQLPRIAQAISPGTGAAVVLPISTTIVRATNARALVRKLPHLDAEIVAIMSKRKPLFYGLVIRKGYDR